MQAHTGNLTEALARLSSMTLSDQMNETKLSLLFPAKTKLGRLYTKTMELEFKKNSYGGGGGIRYRWTGYIETPQMKVAYCWSTKRNKAGYFLGWRQIERKARPGHVVRDQLIARKSKKRLSIRQEKLGAKLRLKGA